MKVLEVAKLQKFSRKYPASRKALNRFFAIACAAAWPHFPALKQTFPAADYVPGTGRMVFDIGGNKYRLIASVDFEEQLLLIEEILTHEQYDRT
jgi:mRNA interferase HigB